MQVVTSDKDICNQNDKSPTPPYPLSSTYYWQPLLMQRLQNTVSPTPYLKKAYHITCILLGSISIVVMVIRYFVTNTLLNWLSLGPTIGIY